METITVRHSIRTDAMMRGEASQSQILSELSQQLAAEIFKDAILPAPYTHSIGDGDPYNRNQLIYELRYNIKQIK